MKIVKCGKKGQVTIPRAVLDRLGIVENTPMLLDVTDDGAIVLRQAAVLPVETYSDARIAEFEREGAVGGDDRAAARAARLRDRNYQRKTPAPLGTGVILNLVAGQDSAFVCAWASGSPGDDLPAPGALGSRQDLPEFA